MLQPLCFNDFTFSPVTRDSQPWFKSSELARALGYANDNYVTRLYRRNEDEFSSDMTQLIENSAEIQFGSEGRSRIFSLRGCHLLAMFARTPVAKAFRRWVLDVIEQYGDRVPVAEPVTLNDELISAAERAELKLIVDAKLSTYPAAVQGKARAEIWTKHNRHFRIAEYSQLPARLMPEAREFLLSVRVRAINAIPTAESAIPYPSLPVASSLYRDRVRELERLEQDWMELAVLIRDRAYGLERDFRRVTQGTYPELLRHVSPSGKTPVDALIQLMTAPTYTARQNLESALDDMRLAIRAAKTANRLMLG